MSDLKEKWEELQARVHAAEKKAARKAGSVQILPITKTHPAEELKAWLELPGFPRVWGENYVQELQEKSGKLRAMAPDLRWHYVGAIQSRKIEELCPLVDCLQSVSRVKEVEFLKKAQEKSLPVPNFFLQVNVSGEAQKNGVDGDLLPELIEEIDKRGLSQQLRGLMCLPESLASAAESELRRQFSKLRELRDHYLKSGLLSMGMSSDFEVAIAEGSDLIRLGTVLFGERIKIHSTRTCLRS